MIPTDSAIKDTILKLALERGAEKTFRRSDAARAVAPQDRRELMPRIRQVAATLPHIRATQKGIPADPVNATGPIRLGPGQS